MKKNAFLSCLLMSQTLHWPHWQCAKDQPITVRRVLMLEVASAYRGVRLPAPDGISVLVVVMMMMVVVVE